MRTFLEKSVNPAIVNGAIALSFLAIVVSGFPFIVPEVKEYVRIFELVCAAYFIFEVCCKVWLNGFRSYWASNLNRFDFVIVVAATIGAFFLVWGDSSLRFLIVMRSARLLMFLRILKYIPDHERIILGLKRALRASIGVSIFLAVYNAINAVICYELFGTIVPELFGDPAISFYSVFKVMTIEGWYDVPDAIYAASNPVVGFFARVYFSAIVISGGILGLSLANAIFVDEMTMDNNIELEEKLDLIIKKLGALEARSAADVSTNAS